MSDYKEPSLQQVVKDLDEKLIEAIKNSEKHSRYKEACQDIEEYLRNKNASEEE